MTPRPPHFWIAIWFGVGRLTPGPGTWATAAALPLHWLLALFAPPALHAAAVMALAGLAVWSAGKVAALLGEDDPQIVVVDEVVGALFALGFVAREAILAQIAALILFRLFDIAKPWPIRLADRLRPPGLGIVADDVAAGLAAGALTALILRLF